MRITPDKVRFIGLIIWPLALLALAACVLAAALFGGSYFVQLRDRSMADFNQPPIYPAAQQVTVVRSDTSGKQITFETADSPAAVLDYYRQALTRQGWQERDIYVPLTPGSDGRNSRTHPTLPASTWVAFTISTFCSTPPGLTSGRRN